MRVQVKHVWEVPVSTLADCRRAHEDETTMQTTLDPLTQGYALTGDQNIVHVDMVARYRVRDPAEWAFYGPKSEDVLRVEVTAAMVRSLGEMGVDRVLSDGRKSSDRDGDAPRAGGPGCCPLRSRAVVARTHASRSSAGSGERVRRGAERLHRRARRRKKEAQAFAESAIPQAQAEADAAVQAARADADCRSRAAPRAMPRPFWRSIRSIGPTRRWCASAFTAMPWSAPSAAPATCAGCRRRSAAATTGSASPIWRSRTRAQVRTANGRRRGRRR